MSQISVNYAALQAAETQIKSISRAMDDKLAALRGRLQQVVWEGQDRQRYAEHQAKWDQAVADMNQVLAQIGAAVGVANSNYQQTEQANASMW
jgi:early secretory antigenic target protein ESAT-6